MLAQLAIGDGEQPALEIAPVLVAIALDVLEAAQEGLLNQIGCVLAADLVAEEALDRQVVASKQLPPCRQS